MKHTISTVVIALCVCVIAHAAGTPPAGVYIGTTDNFRFRSFALVIRDDGTGVFIPGPGNQGEPPYGGRRQWLEVFAPSSDTFELGAPGTDFWHQISITPSGALSGIMRFPRAPSIPDIRIQAERSVSTIAAAKYAGYYRGDGVSFIIAPSGQLFVICATDARNDVGLSGAGYVGPGGQISASGGFRLSFSGQIEDGILTGTVYSAGFFSSDFSCINPAFAARATFANTSALLRLSASEPVAIVGFVTASTTPSNYLLRAVGPSLASFGVGGAADSPTLTVYSGGQTIARNSGWFSASNAAAISTAAAAAGAFPLPPNSDDSASLAPVGAGQNHMVIDGTGSVLAEIYPTTSAAGELVNMSTRVTIVRGSTASVGFVLAGTVPRKVLIRAVGPGLARFGIPNFVAEPAFTVYSGGQSLAHGVPASAIDLSGISEATGAFGLGATTDQVALLELPPGAYTVEVSASTNAAGVALLELYRVP